MNLELENFSTEKLIQLALTESETQVREYITILHFRGNLEVLQIEFLLKELTSDCVGYLVLEAAEEIGDFRLYPALVNLREWLNEDKDLLESAIELCSLS
jgi:hypothetical protein